MRLLNCFLKNNYMLCTIVASLFVALLLAIFNFNTIASSHEMYKTYSLCDANEVWFTTVAVDNDCFINLNGEARAKTGKKSINADIFMQMNDVSYSINLFDVDEQILDNQCYISRNVSLEYDVEVGDCITIGDNNASFEIVRIFDAQPGLDKKYEHEGIIVISNNEELLTDDISYMFFAVEAKNVLGNAKLVDLKNAREKILNKRFRTIIYLVLEWIAYLVIITLIQKRGRINNYAILRREGLSIIKALIMSLRDATLGFAIQMLIVFLLKSLSLYDVYRNGSLLLIGISATIALSTLFLLTIVYFVRGVKNEQ